MYVSIYGVHTLVICIIHSPLLVASMVHAQAFPEALIWGDVNLEVHEIVLVRKPAQ